MNIFNHTKSYSGIAMLQEVVNKLPKRLQDSINIPFEEHGFKDDENDFSKDYLRFALHDELMKAKLELGKAINGNKGISGISRNTVWYGQIKDGDTNLTDRVYQELCEDGSVYTDITMLRLLQMQLDVHAEVINGHEVDLINVVGSEEHFQNALKKLIDFKVNDGFFAINIGYGGFSEKALGQNYWIGGYLMKCTRQYEFYYLDPKISNSCYSDAFQQIKAIVNKKSIMIKNFSVNLQVSSGFKKSFDCGPFVIFMLESLKKISNLPITLALYKNQLMSFIGWLPYNYESSISMGHKLREEYLVLFNALECEKSFESDDGEYSGNVQGGLLKNDIVYNLRLIKNTVHVQDKDSVVFVEERILNQNNVVDVISNWTKSNNEQKHYLSILTVENTEGKKHALALHVENLGGFMKIKIFNSLSLQDSQFQEQVSEIQKLLSAFPAFIYYIDNGSQDPDSGTCCDHSLHQLLDIYTNEIVGVNSNNFLARDEIPMEQYRIPMVPTASLNFAYMMNIKKQAQAEYSEANVIQDELYANIQPIYFVNPSHIFEF